MQAIIWWGIPIGATLLAVLWLVLAGRSRPPADAHDTVERFHRFRSAMEQQTGTDEGRRRPPGGRR